jgi:hypothetical protein|tara:strand:+ start:385 stop:867 length:483 start_codon:yes stop_codon:yes gene_type:complete
MNMKAKPVLKNKFWIVEQEGVRIGTLSKEDEGFVVHTKGSIQLFKSENQLKRKLGKNLFAAVEVNPDPSIENEVHGYTTRCLPYNSMYDLKSKLPLFTKSKKSKSLYCAGYYLIKFNVNWLKSYCPKLITLQRNEFSGPFKTEIEMKAALSNVNRTLKHS